MLGRELAHVGADLGEQHLGGAPVDAGDRVQQLQLTGERGGQLLDSRRDQWPRERPGTFLRGHAHLAAALDILEQSRRRVRDLVGLRWINQHTGLSVDDGIGGAGDRTGYRWSPEDCSFEVGDAESFAASLAVR